MPTDPIKTGYIFRIRSNAARWGQSTAYTAVSEDDEYSSDAEGHPLSADERQKLDAIVTLNRTVGRVVQEHFKKILPQLDILPTKAAA